jgi:putative aldouronate transport system substrate-binding protein
MEKRWANLEKLEYETFSKIVTGQAPISSFDTFVKKWKAEGGDTIIKEIAN